MPGPPMGPAFCSTSTWFGRHIKRGIVNARLDVIGVFENERRSAMLAKCRTGGGVLDDRTVRRQVAAQNAQAAFGG